jgi:hypothetical protein
LKSPNVFGFTGVFLPLARHLQILDDQRMPGPQLVPLLRAWEVDQSLQGFTDNTPGTPGYRFRSRLNEQVAEGLKRGHCTEPSGSRLWKQICNSLHPVGAGPQERQLLTDRFLSPDLPVTAWLADSVRDLDDLDELSLVMHLRGTRPPGDVQMRLEAIERYEEVCRILDAAFRQIRRVSTHRGTKPVDGTTFASDEVLTEVSQLLPSRMELAMTAVGRLNGELPLMLGDRLGRFEPAMSSSELAETLLVHHESVQSAKAPRGKRSWFDRQVSGWVVRSLYWNHDEVNLDSAMFLHPYRISALQTFMKDLSS